MAATFQSRRKASAWHEARRARMRDEYQAEAERISSPRGKKMLRQRGAGLSPTHAAPLRKRSRAPRARQAAHHARCLLSHYCTFCNSAISRP
jgi:hypothetical protein